MASGRVTVCGLTLFPFTLAAQLDLYDFAIRKHDNPHFAGRSGTAALWTVEAVNMRVQVGRWSSAFRGCWTEPRPALPTR